MSTLLSPPRVLPSLLDDDDFGLPTSLFDNELWNAPTRLFSTPFFRNAGLPAVNVKDLGDRFELELAAPGYKKEDLKVHLEKGVLTVSSEKRNESDEEKNGYTRREFTYQTFKRAFQLPGNTDADQVKARYVDGILRLTVPKTKALPGNKGKEVRIA